MFLLLSRIWRAMLRHILVGSARHGAMIITETPRDFVEYMDVVKARINGAYPAKDRPADSLTVASFKIEKTGCPSGAILLKSSGSTDFDEKCLLTLIEAGPYGPFRRDVELHAFFNETAQVSSFERNY